MGAKTSEGVDLTRALVLVARNRAHLDQTAIAVTQKIEIGRNFWAVAVSNPAFEPVSVGEREFHREKVRRGQRLARHFWRRSPPSADAVAPFWPASRSFLKPRELSPLPASGALTPARRSLALAASSHPSLARV